DVLRQRFSHIFGEKQLSFSSYAGFETLRGDESLLRRALSNLLSNAYRYSDEGSTVTMRAYENEDGFNIGVHNWGVVITEEEKEKIFNRLYRGEFARKTPGSGLGLTIVYQIAQLHQASVSVDSGPERGTVFTLTFPHSNSHSDEEA
ncbi:MAG: ATP-binding protein, partial [Sphaerochaetaceae bacterium]|nr:ATP-binding protein [Sphaerochaetaceae bacterium]